MADVLDYKKEYKDFYSLKTQPMLIEIPEIHFVAIEGKGDPNDKDGEYAKAIELLYAIQYTIKMSKMGDHIPEGYFDYVVPPLEGLWWVDNKDNIKNKSQYIWNSIIRLPEFVNDKIFKRACDTVKQKKNLNTEKAKYLKTKEGLCVQCMHLGPFDEEPKTMKLIDSYIEENNLLNDINKKRWHHEIYLSDPRKVEPSKLKTVLRIPVKKI
ncbi:conserved hypothetical protein [Treponema primitia ZAS-2]|uniref:GyrI-like small molecule binding domain-containing protein n=1 Tax=Treponema primitia (strain ATCC BAA-887 / DSM 12427 / ZAS-2) TaxID=545694 RepID=F5YLM1_TREPZ|nr:GyrI-like domain-containing protein [Treponema primitia]AEF86667.1 conserved hypothetical protein [Treponema primitia ZAS-2]